jgi:hypothetical protein
VLTERSSKQHSRVDGLFIAIPLCVALVSLLVCVFFAGQSRTGGLGTAAIAVSIVQIILAAVYRTKGNGRLLPLLALFFVAEVSLFMAAPASAGNEGPMRLVQVAIVLTSFSTVLVALLVGLGYLGAAPALVVALVVVAIGLGAEIGLSLLHPKKAPVAVNVSRLINNMHTATGPGGVQISQDSETLYYRGSPQTVFQEADPREAEWSLLTGGESKARLVFPKNEPGAARVEIIKRDSDLAYHVFIWKEHFVSKANTKYFLSFRARADRPRRVSVGFARPRDWTNLGWGYTQPLTTQWQTFKADFATNAQGDADNAAVHFNVGDDDAAVEIADVHLKRLSDNVSLDPKPPVLPGTYIVTYNFNGEGCRAGNYTGPKPAGTKRILLLGNSFALGAGIPDEGTVAAGLEKLLNADQGANSPPKYQVINCGQSGYGTHEERMFYNLLGADYRPDIVLVAATWRDDMSVWEEVSPPALGRFESMFFSFQALRGHLNANPHTDFTRIVEELRQLNTDTQRRGAALAVFIFRNNADYAGSTESGKTWNLLTKTITDGLKGSNIPVLDTGKVLTQGNADDLKAHAPIPQDPNEPAHAIAARQLVPFLRENHLIAQ